MPPSWNRGVSLLLIGVVVLSAVSIFQSNPFLLSLLATDSSGSSIFQVVVSAANATKQINGIQTLHNVSKDDQSRGHDTDGAQVNRTPPVQQQHQTTPPQQQQQQETTTSQKQQQQEEKKRPLNIVLFYADDWSFQTLGAMGNTYVQTPVLDQLAKEGVLFTHNCVTTSICMQSRATLYTGQYSSRHKTLYSWREITMYEPERWNNTLYPLLMRAGYHTMFVGKYHHTERWPKDIPTFSKSRFYQTKHWHLRNGVEKHVTQLNEEDGIEFLNDRPRDQPFFLTISFFATHAEDFNKEQYRPMNSSMHLYQDEPVPLPKTYTEKHWMETPYFFRTARNFGRGRFLKRYRTPELYQHHMKNTLRMATEVDTACGRIMEALKEQGVLDSTMIIFTTDNGNSHGQHGLAEKWFAYEESLRVPLIIKDPRMPPIMIGTINDEFTLNIDLAPTVLKAAGVDPPDVMQGRDMASLYLHPEETAKSWRKEFFYEFRNDNKGIPNSLALVRKDFKFVYWEDYNYTQCFDMVNDPLEEFDLFNQTKPGVLWKAKERMNELGELVKQPRTRV